MKFISTKNMTAENAPEDQVLVQYLEPFFGYYKVEFAIGYFETDAGWLLWHSNKQINVIAYAELPEPMETENSKLSQIDFITKYRAPFPNYGNVGE